MNKKIILLISMLTLVLLVACQRGPVAEEISNDPVATKEEKSVIIGSKPMAEQYILVEILSQIIEDHTDIKVEKKLGIAGGTSNLHPAIIEGSIDMYPEYSGTGWLFVLKEDLINNPDELFQKTREKYEENYNLIWTEAYGFNNTFAIAMKDKKAEEMGIVTISDLAKKSQELNFAANYDFYEREDGFPGLVNLYGLNFKDKIEVDIALKYKAIDSSEADVINGFSTDGLLKEYNMRVLKDDKDFFPSYKAATVIRKETLSKYPELIGALDKMTGLISDEDMISMNFQVEKEGKDPEDVAEAFLIEKGLK